MSKQFTVPTVEGYGKEGKTVGYIYSGGTPVGIFTLSDACRSGVVEAIKELKSLGIKTAMLTGDSHAAAMQTHGEVHHNITATTHLYFRVIALPLSILIP